MGTANGPRIIAGVSGSRASLRALRWAAAEASSRHARLEVVMAWQPWQPAHYAAGPHADHGQQRAAAESKLLAVLRTVFEAEPAAGLRAAVVEGPPERVLTESSADAALLVIGSSSSAPVSERPVGPVTRGCLSRARCPVVIIGPWQDSANSLLPAGDVRPRASSADYQELGYMRRDQVGPMASHSCAQPVMRRRSKNRRTPAAAPIAATATIMRTDSTVKTT